MSLVELLRRICLFVDLRDEDLKILATCMGRCAFAQEVTLYHRGSSAQYLYLVASGAVRIYVPGEAGHEMTLDVYGSGECFGETVFLDDNRRLTDAMTLQRTVTYTLARNDLLRCVEQHPQVARRAMALLAHRLDQTTTYAERLAFLDVEGRLAAVLVEMAMRYGTGHDRIDISLHLTQAQLANWTVSSREMVNRVLGSFRDQGLIRADGHSITILELESLKRKAAGRSFDG
jgi:CRP-like cAMP-binding protein